MYSLPLNSKVSAFLDELNSYTKIGRSRNSNKGKGKIIKAIDFDFPVHRPVTVTNSTRPLTSANDFSNWNQMIQLTMDYESAR